MMRPCLTCGRLTQGSYCPAHQPARKTPGRSSRPQASFSATVLDRAGHRCQYLDGDGNRCPATEGLEAHHLTPFGESRSYDPTAGVALCSEHHHEVERLMRDEMMRRASELARAGIEYWGTDAGKAEIAQRRRRARL